MPFFGAKHAVIETPTFLGDCARAGLSENGRHDIVDAIADDPTAGDLMPGALSDDLRWWAGQRGAPAVWRGLLFVVLGLSLLLLLEPLRQPQPHRRHVG